jgi:dolichol kinase
LTKPVLEIPAIADLPAAGPVVRPTNVARSLFHVTSGVVALAALRFLPSRTWLVAASGTFAGAGWFMEAMRRRSVAFNGVVMRVFAPVAHPHERHRVNSSTWYCTALFAIAIAAPVRAAEIGVIVLALADPAAGIVGRRFGRTRIVAGRSLEGSLAFLIVGALAAFAWLSAVHGLARPAAIVVAAAAAVAGTLAEVVSTRLDDNLTIPIASAAAAAAAEMVLPLL